MLAAVRKRLKRALLERCHLPYSPISGLTPAVFSRFRCRPRDDISLVDIGAHRGDFTLAMRKLCHVSRAVLVEPIERLAADLRQHPDLAGYYVYDCAVGDRDGEIEMNIFGNSPYISSALPLDSSTPDLTELAVGGSKMVRRPALTLDTILAQTDIRSIDLMKIDVQGFEDRVIKGARDALTRTACVFMEVSFRPLYHGSAIFGDIHALMYQNGFFLGSLEPGFVTRAGELLQADALFFRQ